MGQDKLTLILTVFGEDPPYCDFRSGEIGCLFYEGLVKRLRGSTT